MKKFNVGIKALIKRGDKVLIAKANRADKYWEVPGGRIDDDESIEEALHRELREELPNIKAVILGEVIDAQRLHKDIEPDLSLVLVFYTVEADFEGGEPELSDEHVEYKWATKKEALEMVFESCRRPIQKLFDQ